MCVIISGFGSQLFFNNKNIREKEVIAFLCFFYTAISLPILSFTKNIVINALRFFIPYSRVYLCTLYTIPFHAGMIFVRGNFFRLGAFVYRVQNTISPNLKIFFMLRTQTNKNTEYISIYFKRLILVKISPFDAKTQLFFFAVYIGPREYEV